MIKKRHKAVYTLLRPFFRLYLRVAYHYTAEPAPAAAGRGAKLILANHNCNLDPFLLALSFCEPIYFVASDHIFRLGLISRLIHFLVAPIPIVKSQIDLKTLRMIREILAEGGSVGLFPEGNRSFNGRTGWISPATGKLARQLKSPLVLYRIDGGYLTTPRWGRYKRKGKMQGRVVRVIQPDELAARSAEDIQQIIETSLFVDAYEEQRLQPVAFTGRRLAENLELSLFTCPRCHVLAGLTSQDDQLRCRCGLQVRINQLGFLLPQDSWSKEQASLGLFHDTVASWDDWQINWLKEQLQADRRPDWLSENLPLFSDERQTLCRTERASRHEKMASGRLALYSDRLVLETAEQPISFPFTDIRRVIVHGPQTLQFSTEDQVTYEVHAEHRRSAYKYVILFDLLTHRLKG